MITTESAKNEKSEVLIQALNMYRSDSGAYLAAKTEILFRADRRLRWQRFWFAVLGAAVTTVAFLLKQFLTG